MKAATQKILANALLLPRKSREELIEALEESLGTKGLDLSEADFDNVRRYLDEVVNEMDQEARAQRRGDYDVPKIWRSRYYLRQGYHLGRTSGGHAVHWQGGEPSHKGAACPHCGKPLHLLWDIDCEDTRFRKESPKIFGKLKRLPLYFCLYCAHPIAYRCVGRQLQILKLDGEGDESPFRDFPDAFPRRRLTLHRIPPDIENLIKICDLLGDDWLRARHRKTLADYFASSTPQSWGGDIRRSQFGGLPVLQQGDQDLVCPYASCPTHTWGHPLLRNRRYYLMKLLAVIDEDASFPMETNCAQVVFHFCWACQSVHGEYQID